MQRSPGRAATRRAQETAACIVEGSTMVVVLTGSKQDHVRCWLVSKAGTQAVSWAIETGMLLTLTGDLKPVLG